ncbi:hypothetical protein MROS_0686 [Melioribacter roseus P3M-2]|jgi:hypothetical protein|uniref:Lipoprotein n=1 Tax=Melioribacter roseus (strain DSM 23840 / JCM 17771 / VKM B-2668 / P3M-2) TaxID=1191523 RepID=I6ZPI2_MELRP|nr:hypothetical protein [Melioribacter roseus]AFN73929.1 hypothetical protein MROS_0686 [Melioribacter roseus P3M-2]
MRNIILILILFLAGCSAKEVSVKTIRITHNDYSFYVPEGWLVFDTNSAQRSKSVMLTNKSRNAFILINRINTNTELPLDEMATLSRYFLKLNFGKNFNGFSDITFTRRYALYRFVAPQGIKGRVIIKKVNSNYYEITGYSGNKAGEDELNKVQEMIAESLK